MSEGSSIARPGTTLSLLFELFVANQRVRTLLQAAMADAGLRPDEYAVYSAVFELGPISPSELGETLGMPRTTVTHYMDAMRAAGHLHERRNPADGRSYLVRLTPSGLAAQRRANRGFEAAYQRLAAHLADAGAVGVTLRELAEAAGLAAAELAADARSAAG